VTAGHSGGVEACSFGSRIATGSRPVRGCRDAHRWPRCDRPSLGCCPGPTGSCLSGSRQATSPGHRTVVFVAPSPSPAARPARRPDRRTAVLRPFVTCRGLLPPNRLTSASAQALATTRPPRAVSHGLVRGAERPCWLPYPGRKDTFQPRAARVARPRRRRSQRPADRQPRRAATQALSRAEQHALVVVDRRSPVLCPAGRSGLRSRRTGAPEAYATGDRRPEVARAAPGHAPAGDRGPPRWRGPPDPDHGDAARASGPGAGSRVVRPRPLASS
jgi:hypothetical protein